MVKVVEVMLELQASDFINSGKTTKGRVVREIPGGDLSCQLDDRVKGATKPQGPFCSVEDARDAIIQYWDKCNKALESHHWDSDSR